MLLIVDEGEEAFIEEEHAVTVEGMEFTPRYSITTPIA